MRTVDWYRTPQAWAEWNPRKVEMLELMAEGLTNQQIADRMGISPHTVKGTKKNILKALKAKNSNHAISIILRNGVLF